MNRTAQHGTPRARRYQPVIEAPAGADYRVTLHGSIALLHLLSAEASEWVHENVQGDAQHFGGALVVEPRYLDALLDGLASAGLVGE